MIIIISYQYLRISIAMVTSPRYTNVNRKGTSKCKNLIAFCQAFSGNWVQWWGSSHLCLEISTGNSRVCSVLRPYQPFENGKLSSWGSSHLADSLLACPSFQKLFLITDVLFEPSWPYFWGTQSSHTSNQSQGGNLQRGSSAITCLAWHSGREGQSCRWVVVLACPPSSSASFLQASAQKRSAKPKT